MMIFSKEVERAYETLECFADRGEVRLFHFTMDMGFEDCIAWAAKFSGRTYSASVPVGCALGIFPDAMARLARLLEEAVILAKEIRGVLR